MFKELIKKTILLKMILKNTRKLKKIAYLKDLQNQNKNKKKYEF